MSDDTYLSADELERLTGKKYGKAQCKVLAARGWVFEPGDDGRPIVLRAYHDQRLGLKGPAKRRRPRLDGLAA